MAVKLPFCLASLIVVVGLTSCREEKNKVLRQELIGIPTSESDATQRVSLYIRDLNISNTVLTPMMIKLTDIGIPALQLGVTDLLLSEEPLTRQRAQGVLRGVIFRHYGCEGGRGWTQAQAESARDVINEIDYYWDAPPQEREQAARRVRQWVETNRTALLNDWGYVNTASK